MDAIFVTVPLMGRFVALKRYAVLLISPETDASLLVHGLRHRMRSPAVLTAVMWIVSTSLQSVPLLQGRSALLAAQVSAFLVLAPTKEGLFHTTQRFLLAMVVTRVIAKMDYSPAPRCLVFNAQRLCLNAAYHLVDGLSLLIKNLTARIAPVSPVLLSCLLFALEGNV
jgi:hypothetical protein